MEITADVTKKRQTTITGCNSRQTIASIVKDNLTISLVEALLAANIPMEKLVHPKLREFFLANVKGGDDIPKSNWLREQYVPKILSKQQEKVAMKLARRKVAIIADETTNVVGRYVVTILLQPLDSLDADNNCKALLVNTEFLPTVNNVTIAQLIIRVLTNINTDFNNVLALISDNAANMKKCFTDDLRGLLPNTVHVTC